MAKIVIRQESCKGCGVCVEVCAKKLITLMEAINSLGCHPAVFEDNGVECTACKLCAEMCPDVCIEVYK
ncbi:MAG: 4Fe-4S dicluster domain-containing protein [bacterium]